MYICMYELYPLAVNTYIQKWKVTVGPDSYFPGWASNSPYPITF